ncbi:thioesterase-like superfamily-domain-containing protein [Favolaschia claudopus]|uniref:Thioesterase-like superfamily-domain-containing protein n=1 Tax=Favolaschia claudopus TaxID=2862362 RepID=A0AAW0DYH0_9AGAR
MAPLSKALNVDLYKTSDSDTKIFRGNIDPEWTVGNVPNGGYALALVVESCIRHQASTGHRDPIHVTAHFLQATSIAPFQVYVRTLKHGRGFTNVLADLIQQHKTRITTHIIFGSLSAPRLVPPSPYARRLPLYVHPSVAVDTQMARPWRFKKHIRWAADPFLRAQNDPTSRSRTSSTTIGGGGLVWGAWFQLTGIEEQITPVSIAFLADTFNNLPSLLPRSERGGLVPCDTWFPTMTLSIEFKAPIPPPSLEHSARTVGLYSTGTFWGEPQGRHDAYVEIWTAPVELGEGSEREGWRENQVCLATATQMALSMSMKVNAERAKYDAPKVKL